MQLPDSPDVLIVPSKMACLVDFVGDTLYANPGSLAKDTEAESYLKVQIAPGSGSVKDRAELPVIHI